ncbi:MAG: haloalkane dehalogenase [bacterium]
MINPKMKYEKKFAEVLGKKMTYVEAGEGDPIVFFHGNITSSYMWRNIIPHVEGLGRCIAIDNIGQGDSDKLEGSMYRLADHQPYTNGLMEALGVEENFTVVVHDWGAQLAFTWAAERRERLKGIVLCQGVVGNFLWSHWPPEVQALFKRFRSGEGEELVLKQNFFVEKILPSMVVREVTEEIHNEYRRPYRNPGEDRRPTLTWPREIPIEGEPADVLKVIERNNAWIAQSPVPKLFINTDPGAVLVGEHREMIRGRPNVSEVTVKGLHYCHEDSPGEMGGAIAEWYKTLA